MKTYVDEQTKRDEPADGHKDVKRPVHKGGRQRDEPQQRHEDGEAGDDLGVDEAAEAVGVPAGAGEDPARDARDDGGEDELRRPEDDVDEAGEHG